MQCLLVKVVGVCLKRSLFCLRRVTPGLCAVMVDGGTDFAFSVGKPAFRQHLALVSSLNTHIFLFHLMHLRMGGVGDLMDRPGKRIVPQVSVGAFLHFFKVKLRLAFSGCLVKNTLGTEKMCIRDRPVRGQPPPPSRRVNVPKSYFLPLTPSLLFGNSSLKLMYLPPVSSRITAAS